ncbi:RNase H family protein [Trifolium repens]|nr:RNase H family protein [Trifolium repens]
MLLPDSHSLSRDCSRPKTIPKNSTLESFILIEAANSAIMSPQSFLKTPPMPAAPGLPFEEPSTFHFHSFCAGRCQSEFLLTVCFFPHLHTSRKFLVRSSGEYGHSGHHAFILNRTLIFIRYASSIQSILLFSKTSLFR